MRRSPQITPFEDDDRVPGGGTLSRGRRVRTDHGPRQATGLVQTTYPGRAHSVIGQDVAPVDDAVTIASPGLEPRSARRQAASSELARPRQGRVDPLDVVDCDNERLLRRERDQDADGARLSLFDPLTPPTEIEKLGEERETAIVLTCPWYRRDAETLANRYRGAPVRAAADKGDSSPVDGTVFREGDRLPVGVEAFPGMEANDLVLWATCRSSTRG
jgi:hypothetical protein